MRWRERGIMGGFILAVLVFTVVLVQRQWELTGEEHRFEALRKQVRTGKAEMRVSGEAYGDWEVERIEKQGGEMLGREILLEYQALYRRNSDFAGWIFAGGTRIDYPIVERQEDREYYLHRNFAGESSYAGVPFVGHGSLGAKQGTVCIYGHNMKNGSMFADFLKYKDKEFWVQNPVISLDTLYEHQTYAIFAAFYVSAKAWEERESFLFQAITGDGQEGFESMLKLKEQGLYETDVELTEGKRVVLFVTCSYQKKEERFVVAGIEIHKGSTDSESLRTDSETVKIFLVH